MFWKVATYVCRFSCHTGGYTVENSELWLRDLWSGILLHLYWMSVIEIRKGTGGYTVQDGGSHVITDQTPLISGEQSCMSAIIING